MKLDAIYPPTHGDYQPGHVAGVGTSPNEAYEMGVRNLATAPTPSDESDVPTTLQENKRFKTKRCGQSHGLEELHPCSANVRSERCESSVGSRTDGARVPQWGPALRRAAD